MARARELAPQQGQVRCTAAEPRRALPLRDELAALRLVALSTRARMGMRATRSPGRLQSLSQRTSMPELDRALKEVLSVLLHTCALRAILPAIVGWLPRHGNRRGVSWPNRCQFRGAPTSWEGKEDACLFNSPLFRRGGFRGAAHARRARAISAREHKLVGAPFGARDPADGARWSTATVERHCPFLLEWTRLSMRVVQWAH